uniref:Uncharacterized protein n=1 Tax=Lepeophtheirus salmonis TaxID=72036 RepID=A0A0K2TVL3_LEPSM
MHTLVSFYAIMFIHLISSLLFYPWVGSLLCVLSLLLFTPVYLSESA